MEAKINARELRIGCWALFPDGKPYQISGMDLFDMTTTDEDDNPLLTVTAIPLTEDILLKAGFIERQHKFFVLDHVELGYITNDQYLQFDYKFKFIDIKYVHQLQNLYFTLINKELTINI